MKKKNCGKENDFVGRVCGSGSGCWVCVCLVVKGNRKSVILCIDRQKFSNFFSTILFPVWLYKKKNCLQATSQTILIKVKQWFLTIKILDYRFLHFFLLLFLLLLAFPLPFSPFGKLICWKPLAKNQPQNRMQLCHIFVVHHQWFKPDWFHPVDGSQIHFSVVSFSVAARGAGKGLGGVAGCGVNRIKCIARCANN